MMEKKMPPLTRAINFILKSTLYLMIMTTVPYATQTFDTVEEDKKQLAQDLITLHHDISPAEILLSMKDDPQIKKFKKRLRKREAMGEFASDKDLTKELDDPEITKVRVKKIFDKFLKERKHEMLDLVLKNGRLLERYVIQALVDEFCEERRDITIISLLKHRLTPYKLKILKDAAEKEKQGVEFNIRISDNWTCDSVRQMMPQIFDPELWIRQERESLQKKLVVLEERKKAFTWQVDEIYPEKRAKR